MATGFSAHPIKAEHAFPVAFPAFSRPTDNWDIFTRCLRPGNAKVARWAGAGGTAGLKPRMSSSSCLCESQPPSALSPPPPPPPSNFPSVIMCYYFITGTSHKLGMMIRHLANSHHLCEIELLGPTPTAVNKQCPFPSQLCVSLVTLYTR